MRDISQNIKKVLAIFLLLFIMLISYIMYIYVVNGEKIASSTFNNRLWFERNNTERGSILDRNKNILVKSNGVKNGKQSLNYVGGEAFSHALGYMDDVYGLTGLQRIYDKELMGKIEGVFNPVNKKGIKKGYDLVTTLDSELQKKANELLEGRKGAIVALDPSTGEILAVVSKPTYDPNDLKKSWKGLNQDKNSPLLNRATAGLYPPGSIFKVVTATSALQNIPGVANKTFNDNGVLKFNNKYSLKNYGGYALGSVDFRKAFIKSSNVVFGQLGIDLGNEKLKETAEKFFFNKNIAAEGLVIENSRFPELKNYEKGNIAQSAIGQASVLTTPMEMALVASSVANNGKLMKPIMVTEVIDNGNKKIKSYKGEILGEPLSSEQANLLKGYMKDVVNEGTGKKAAIDGIQVCGKTGTAEHVESSESHSWFMGFAPYEKPKIAFAVLVEEGGTGGSTAASISKELVKSYLKR